MKKVDLILASIIIVALQACRPTVDIKSQNRLKYLFERKDYFELKALFDSCANRLPAEQQLFYRAILLNYDNKCDSSNLVIEDALKHHGKELTDSMRLALYEKRAYNYIRQYQYANAVACYDTLINSFKKVSDSADIADYQNSKLLWGSLKTVKPQMVASANNPTIKWTDDKVGLITVPVSVRQDTAQFIFDTGANISVITQSIAQKWHIKIFDVSFDLGGGTGFTTKSATGVADSLYIGSILVRNAVFLVLPDDALYVKQINYRQQGILGLPILAQLKQWQFSQNGTITVSSKPTEAGFSNMIIDGLMPHVNFKVLNTYLPFRFDSGANSTTLYSIFFEKFKPYILKTAQNKDLKEGGVGGVVTSKVYMLKNLVFNVADKKVIMPEINIRTTPYNKDDRVTAYGNLGRDMIRQNHNKVTINFEEMFIRMD